MLRLKSFLLLAIILLLGGCWKYDYLDTYFYDNPTDYYSIDRTRYKYKINNINFELMFGVVRDFLTNHRGKSSFNIVAYSEERGSKKDFKNNPIIITLHSYTIILHNDKIEKDKQIIFEKTNKKLDYKITESHSNREGNMYKSVDNIVYYSKYGHSYVITGYELKFSFKKDLEVGVDYYKEGDEATIVLDISVKNYGRIERKKIISKVKVIRRKGIVITDMAFGS
jgi:hypothetical protein